MDLLAGFLLSAISELLGCLDRFCFCGDVSACVPTCLFINLFLPVLARYVSNSFGVHPGRDVTKASQTTVFRAFLIEAKLEAVNYEHPGWRPAWKLQTMSVQGRCQTGGCKL